MNYDEWNERDRMERSERGRKRGNERYWDKIKILNRKWYWFRINKICSYEEV